MKRKITKVKWDEKKVRITYEIAAAGDPDEYSLACSEAPHPDFIGALEALIPHAEKIIECEGWLSEAKVRGVSFSHTNGIMGAVITVLRPVKTANSPLVINTPHLPSESYNEDGGEADDKLLPADCIEALDSVLSEARQYLDGKRCQPKLPGMDTQAPADGDKAD